MVIVKKTSYDYKQHIDKVNELSETIPDQTMSLRTILDRYARGLPLGGNPKQPIYEGEDVDGVDISRMDLAEREDYINSKREELETLKKRFKAEKQAKEAEADEQQKRKDNEAEKAEKQAKNSTSEEQ